MMLRPLLSWLAAAAIMTFTGPALAQDGRFDPGPPPPLPDPDERGSIWDDYSDEPYPEDEIGRDTPREPEPDAARVYAPPPLEAAGPLAYSEEERIRWLERCRANRSGGDSATRGRYCEDYLLRYERGFPVGSAGGCPAAPVTWVRVPISRARAGE